MVRRKPVVGVSLKMYQNQISEAQAYATSLKDFSGGETSVEQFFCPAMGVIYPVSQIIDQSAIGLGTQNIAPAANGAYTGEFSIESLLAMGGQYVEVGHCERREYFKETDELIREKVKLTLQYGLIPILCIGENQKESPEQLKKTLVRQLFGALNFLPQEQLRTIIIAYEPVWAIGKSLAASGPYVHHSHQVIRDSLKELFSEDVSESVRIIYGGSVSQENVALLVADEQVDGVFVGRFGHDPERYAAIVQKVKEAKEEVTR